MQALIHTSVAVELDRFPVPEDEYEHLLAGVIGSLAALLSDGGAAVAIDRIELLEQDDDAQQTPA